MARIAISLCGEGRGHATRICTLVEHLQRDHDLLIYTSADAFAFLSRRHAVGAGRVEVREIPGLVFQYTGGRLDVMKTITAGLDYQARILGPLVDRLMTELEGFKADVGITDFEPALPRACARQGIPLISVDHQHFLLAYDLASLPMSLQWHAWMMGHAVWMSVFGASDTVVSAFFRPPLRPGWEHVVQIGPLLRSEISAAVPARGDFVVSYLRRHTPFATLAALADCGLPVKVYGLGERAAIGGLSFHEVDGSRFVDDLVNCRALIAAAGNQLIGEALHLGKPMLVLPENAHAEQMMNAHFLSAMGCGDFCALESVTAERIGEFVASLDRFRLSLAAVEGRMDGTADVLGVIRRRLDLARSAERTPYDGDLPTVRQPPEWLPPR
jgi:uncharacterized protein (TIGR00661 family)